MVKPEGDDAGDGVSGRPAAAPLVPSPLLHAPTEIIEDPAAFLIERLRTILLWQQTGKRLNLMRVGAAAVHGVVRRSQRGHHPPNVFATCGRTPSPSPPLTHAPTDVGASDTATHVRENHASPHDGQSQNTTRTKDGCTGTVHAQRAADGRESRGECRSENAERSPSVARVVLIESAAFCPTPLFMGVVSALLSDGVAAFCRSEAEPAVPPVDALLPSRTAGHHHGRGDGAYTHASSTAAAASTRTKQMAHEVQFCGDGSPRLRLSAEAANALHEIHHAAHHIVLRVRSDVRKLSALFAAPTSPPQQTAPAAAREPFFPEGGSDGVKARSEDGKRVGGAAQPQAEAAEEEEAEDEAAVCTRLTLLTSNLYSLLSLLDFFSVEAAAVAGVGKEAAETTASRRSTPPPRPLSSTTKAATTAASSTVYAAGETQVQQQQPAAAPSKGFLSEFTSAVAAVASAFVDSSSQRGSPALASHAYHSRAAPSTAHAKQQLADSHSASSSSWRHRRSVYTVETFHRLFDVSGHLPRCVWDVLAAVVTVLSQCDVAWSLTHGDATVANNFNATAALVFSEPLQALLRQLHRLCRRFPLLKQRVYGLFPVSPVRFKIKQVLDWSGFLHVDDASYHAPLDDQADLVDLHSSAAYTLYSLKGLWSITAENVRALRRVVAFRYPDEKPPAGREVSSALSPPPLYLQEGSARNEEAGAATAPWPPSTVSSRRVAAPLSEATKTPPASSLIASLASAGSNTRVGNSNNSSSSGRTPNRHFMANRSAMMRHTSISSGGGGGRSGIGRRPLSSTSGSSSTLFAAAAVTAAAAAAAAAATPRPEVHLSTVPGWVGLCNSGNTCFLNSVVQLLFSSTLFRYDLMARVQSAVFTHRSLPSASAHQHQNGPSSSSSFPSVSQAVATQVGAVPNLPQLFTQYGCRLALVLLLGELQWRAQQHYESVPVLPDYLDSHLPAPFNNHRQHDASEFLHALLDQLDEPKQPGGAVVRRWFSGKTATTMRCQRCGHARTHVNSFWDLSTPLLEAPVNTQAHAGGGSLSPAAAAEEEEERGEKEKTMNTQTAAADVAGAATTAAAMLSDGAVSGAAAVDSTLSSLTTKPVGVVVKQVEVEHFIGATATTTTYVHPETADPTTGAAGTPPPKLDAPLQTTRPTIPSTTTAATTTAALTAAVAERETKRRMMPLQHLLLHVLHPTLNMELLHGGNALDCEHCKRRTSTELSTRLVAEVTERSSDADDETAMVRPAATAAAHDDGARKLSPHGSKMAHSSEPINGPMPLAMSASTTNAELSTHSSGEDEKKKREEATSQQQQPTVGTVNSTDDAEGCAATATATTTTAGARLPWYLVIQLNRFAYQRATQSYEKVTAEVPLNEILLLPAYPLVHTPAQNAPAGPAATESDETTTAVGGEEEEQNTAPGGSTAETQNEHKMAAVNAVPSVLTEEVWVAYRLHSIIVHSGSTPNSGHYFTLTRGQSGASSTTDNSEAQSDVARQARPPSSPAPHAADGNAVRHAGAPPLSRNSSATEQHSSNVMTAGTSTDANSAAAAHSSTAAVRAYVQETGAALAAALDRRRVFSAYAPTAQRGMDGAAVATGKEGEEAHETPQQRTEEEEEEEEKSLRAGPPHKAEPQPRAEAVDTANGSLRHLPAHLGNEELSVQPADATTVAATPASPSVPMPSPQHDSSTGHKTDEEKAKKEEEGMEEEKDAQSPRLSPAPLLPPVSVSVSGEAFYDGWVMLNDSNVQSMTRDVMRGILSGEHHRGVYSALETPYLALYEKLPVCYRHQATTSTPAAQGEAEEARDTTRQEAASRIPPSIYADALQRAWEGSDSDANATPVELAAEAVAVFRSRLPQDGSAVPSNKKTEVAAPHPQPVVVAAQEEGVQAADAEESGDQQAAAQRQALAGAHIRRVSRRGRDEAMATPVLHANRGDGKTRAPPQRSHSADLQTRVAADATTPPSSSSRARPKPSLHGKSGRGAGSSSKRLRAMAAHYAQHSKERPARRRLTRAASASDMADGAVDEERMDDDGSGTESDAVRQEESGGDSSDGGVSLD